MAISSNKSAFLIVASGRGHRFGGELPKQYLRVKGRPMLSYGLETALWHPMIGPVIVVIHPDDTPHYDAAAALLRCSDEAMSRVVVAHGGATRQHSVHNGLEALATLATFDMPVLVHDAARPFVSESLITRAIAAVHDHGAAIPVLPVTDTVKRVDAAGMVAETLDRAVLRTVQTPQAFSFGPLIDAHRKAAMSGHAEFPDDASLMEWAGVKVGCFDGERAAFKITHGADIDAAERHLRNGETATIRVATGYDVHALGDGDHVWLGGLKIAHDRGLIGHSDADPVLHALTDAILGTIGEGDIGSHFPPSDMKWKGAASHIFLRHAIDLLEARGGSLIHLDATIICEEPKIGPHREAIRAVIADIVGNEASSVSVKATTSERLGFTGRREGIAAIGTATVKL